MAFRDYVIGSMLWPRPRPSVNPDAAETCCLSTCNVGDEVVTHHPTALGEAGPASLGGDLEEADIRLPYARNS